MRKIKNLFTSFLWAALFAAGSAGTALAQFTGDFSQPGGAVYDGGSSDGGNQIAIDTHSVGGPFLYVVGHSSFAVTGLDWMIIKYDMQGIKLASATVRTSGYDYVGGIAVNNAGNLYVSGQTPNGGSSRIMKYGPNLNMISSVTVSNANVGHMAVGYSNGIEYVYILSNRSAPSLTLDRYDSSLNPSGSVVVVNYNVYGRARVAVKNGYPASVFVTGEFFDTYKFSDAPVFQSSTAFAGGAQNVSLGIAPCAATGDLYVLGYSSTSGTAQGVLVKYDADSLAIKSSTTFGDAWTFGVLDGAVAVDPATYMPYAITIGAYRFDSNLNIKYTYPGILSNSMVVVDSSHVYVTRSEYDNFVTKRINLEASEKGGDLTGGVDGSKQFQMVSDGAGGAYMVYDSTVAEDGLCRIFAERLDANNSVLWGPVEVSTAYYSGGSNDIFAGSDGAGGVIAAWFDGSGFAYAQRYNPGGYAQWGPGGTQISSGPALGGEFHENAEGGFFALFGYPAATGMTVAAQKVNNYGICMWPSAGNCVTGSGGTVIPTGDFNGNARGVDAGSGSLLFAWPGDNGGRLALFGSKVATDGTLAWPKKVLAQSSGDEGATVEGINDGAGGVYLVWTSSSGGGQALFAGRFDSAGDAYPTWSPALRLSDYYAGSSYGMKLAKDEDGFAVMYSTGGNNGNIIHVIRSSAAAGEIAAGWALNGKSVGVGNFGWTSTNLIYSSSAYHFVWSTWEPPAYKVYYQKTDKAGNYVYAGDSMVGTFRAPVNAAIAPDGTGGALAGWKMSIGGDDLPGLKRMLPVTTENGFTGAFSESAGVNYDGGDMDAGFAAAFYGANVYVAGMTVPAGAVVIKYDLAGNMVSSATLAGLESFDGVAVNNNGVYAVGKGSAGFVTAKYSHELVLSSAAVLPGENHARDLALDPAGNVYVIGSNAGEPGGQNDYKIVKYNANLVQLGAPVLFNAGGVDGGKGIAYDSDYIYVTGDSLQGGTTYFVTAKFASSAMLLVSSIAYTGPVSVDANSPVGEKLAVNPVTHDVYFTGNSAKDTILTLKYDRNLAAQQGIEHFSSPAGYAQGTGITLDAEGNVHIAGSYNSGAEDYAVLLKYAPGLVFLSSAASVQPYGYDSTGVAVDTSTGYAYMTGLYASDGNWENQAKFDMRTVRFNPLGGSLPPYIVSTVPEDRSVNISSGIRYIYITFNEPVFPNNNSAIGTDLKLKKPNGTEHTTRFVSFGLLQDTTSTYRIGLFNADLSSATTYIVEVASFTNSGAVMMAFSSFSFTTTGAPLPAFSGSFSEPGGANFDGGDMDVGFGTAHYGSNVYVSGLSLPGGALLVKYDMDGVMVSSAVMSGVESFDAVAVNANGVYVAGKGSVGFVTAKYNFNLQLSSVAVLPGESHARDLALDPAGNVYVIGSNAGEPGGQNDYKIVKYNANLVQLGAPVLFNAGGVDGGKGIAYDSNYIYVTGDSLQGGTTYFVTAKFASSAMLLVSSIAYTGPVSVDANSPVGEKLAVNPVTHDVYFTGNSAKDTILTLKYDRNLAAQQGIEHFSSPAGYAQGTGITLDAEGNVHIAGSYNSGAEDYAVLLKYAPGLVFLSSAASVQSYGYDSMGVALDTATGSAYMTGLYASDGNWENQTKFDMRTVRFAPLGGSAPTLVYLSTRDVSPAYFISGEEAAALMIAPYTGSGETSFSSMTAILNPGGNACSVRAAALYYDSNHNDTWDPGDRLVSSSALNCSGNVTFIAGETIGTQKAAYFVTVTPSNGDNIRLGIPSPSFFEFGAALAEQAIYPITSASTGFGKGSNSFQMLPDGAGGAYMVYDSTIAAGGLRKLFVERVDANNSAVWAPKAVSPAYYYKQDSGSFFAGPDGENGVIVAWFDGNGVAYAQRYDANGAQQWATGGVQISSGVTEGGEFHENAEGGFFALFGYPSAAGMAVTAQKINSYGQCQWPHNAAGNCVSDSTGTVIPVGDFGGEGRGIDGGSGSLLFVWGGPNGGRTELYGSKVAAGGTLAWNKKTMSATSGDEGNSVSGISDGSGGAYLVWTSSTGGEQALYARRFDADGNAYSGWSSPLQLSSYFKSDRYVVNLAKDSDGFAVLYSTDGNSNSEVRIVRAAAAAREFAAGWGLNGKLAGVGGLEEEAVALVSDGAAYHFVWGAWEQPYYNEYYQKMDKSGNFVHAGGSLVNNSPDPLRAAVASDGAGGALAGWKTDIGGEDLPGLKAFPSGSPLGFTGNFSEPGGAVYDGGSYEMPLDVAVDTVAPDGPFIYTAGKPDGLTVKYDKTGVMVASAALSSNGYDSEINGIAIGADSIFVTGYYNGPDNNGKCVTLKYDKNLVLQSSTAYSYGSDDCVANDIALNKTGGIYVTGHTGPTEDSRELLVIKYDDDLTFQKTAVFSGGSYAKGTSIKIDDGGSVYAVGYSSASGNLQILALRYDPELVFVSSAVYAIPNESPEGRISLDLGKDAIYVAGQGSGKGVLLKLDRDLIIKSSAAFNSGAGSAWNGVALDGGGGVFAAGYAYGETSREFLTAKYTPDLVFLSSITYGSDKENVAMGIALDGFDNLYVGGFSSNGKNDDWRLLRYAPSDFGGGLPPYIVSTIPADKAVNVSSGIRYIGITFNEPIFPNDNSVIGTKLKFKKTNGTEHNTRFVSFSLLPDTTSAYRIGLFNADLSSATTYIVEVASFTNSGGVMMAFSSFSFTTTGGASVPVFSGDFSEPGGAVYDGGADDAPHRVAVDTAALNGPFIYGAGTSSFGDDDAFIVKYDKYGVMAASAAFNVSGHASEANGIAVGADSIFVSGNYDGTAHDGKCLILKYNKDLLLQSSATYSSAGYCIANDITVSRSGGVYVTGHVNPSDASRDLVILKYDDNLHLATSAVFSGSYDKGMEIRTDETGNVYAVGYSSVAGNFQILTLKYDPELVFISSAVFSSNQATDENRVSLSLGQTGVYVAGQTGGAYSHGTLLKYDRDLVLRSSAAFDAGADSGWQGVGVNSAGEVFAAGKVYNGNDRDFLTAKYTSELVFVSSIVYDSGHEDAATDIVLDGSDNLYVGGFTSNGKDEDWRTVRYAPSDFGGKTAVVHAKGQEEFVVSETDKGEFGMSAAYGNGKFMAVYASVDNNGDQSPGARLFDTSGNLVGPEIIPADNTDCHSGQGPAVAFDGTNFLMTWGCDLSPNTDAVRGQRVDPSGNKVGSSFSISDFSGDWGDGDVAFDGTNYFTVWSSTESGVWDIYGQFISTSGVLVGPRITIATPVTTWIDHTPVKYGGGKYLVTWTEGNNVKGRLVLPNGSLYGSEIPVNVDSLTSDSPVVISYNPESTKFLVTYGNGIDASHMALYGRFVDLSGVAGSEFPIAEAAGSQSFAAPLWDGSKYLITWPDAFTLSTATVHKRNFSSTGVPLDADTVIASNESGKVPLGAVMAIGGGKALALINRGDIGSVYDPSFDLYGLFLTTAAPRQGAGFTDNFSLPEGAGFDGGDMDFGTETAFYDSHVYVVGLSSPIGAIVVKYDLEGTMVSSSVLAGLESFDGVAVNANGVYAAGKSAAGFVTAKYSHDLVLSSAAVLPGESHARDLALDTVGNVYVVGTNDNQTGYKFVKYNANLVQAGAPVSFNAGGVADGKGIAVDNGNVYITGDSLIGGATYFVTAKYDPSMAFISSVAYADAYFNPEDPGSGKLAVNPATHDVYVTGTRGAEDNRRMVTVRYSQALEQLGSAVFPGGPYGLGMDVTLGDDGNVYALGKDYDGSRDQALVAKYNPALVFLSSAASVLAAGNYMGTGIALDTTTGNSYVTGLSDDKSGHVDMRTVRFAPLGGSLPLVYVSTQDVSPEFYLAGKETAALRLDLRTLSGETAISGISVRVNPNGDYGKIASVGLYRDSNGNNVWDPADQLVSSAAVTSAYVTLPILEGMIYSEAGGRFVTLTPAISAAGSSVNVAIESTGSFSIGGVMAEQAIYPVTSAARPVHAVAGVFSGDFSQAGGAVYAGPDYDLGTDIARNPATGDLYVTVVSSVAGREQALIVKYNSSGVMTASAPVVSAGGMYLLGVAVNANGVYASGGISGGNLALTLKYDLNLRLVSSAAIAGVHSPRVALDAAGNVYLAASSAIDHKYHLAKYGPNLTGLSSATFNAGTGAYAGGIAADGGSVYITGSSLLSGATYFVTARFSAATLAFVSSAVYSGAYSDENLKWVRLAVNPATHDVYLAGTEGTEEARSILTVRYSQNLRQLAKAAFPGGSYQLGFDVKIDSAGYVYTVGKDNDGGSLLPAPRNGRNLGPGRGGGVDRPALLKYSPNLVFISSAAGSSEITTNYIPFALALDTSTGYSYATGGGFDPASDMHTLRFAPMAGLLPVVYISTEDVSPAYYLAGQEAAALRVTLRTNAGRTDILGVKVGVNPSGSYSDIASVGLYLDTNVNGVWDSGDFLISSAAPAGAFVYLPVTDGFIDSNPLGTFITLTPALAGEGHNVNVVVPSSAAFDITGDMAQQAVYPVASAPKLVKFLARLTDLASDPGANLHAVNLSWTYPQDISFGHYVIRYSTNPADLAGPNVYDAQTVTGTIPGVTAGEKWSHNITGLEPVIVNARLFPYYFAAWLFNGTSTSAVSNPAASMYFPETEVKDRDAALRTSASMSVRLESRARHARSSAGMYSAVSFESNGDSFIALNAPGGYSLYYDSMTPMVLRDLAADGAGNAYALVQKEHSVQVVKIGADGTVLNVFSTVSSETAKALAFGAGAVYAATEYAGETGGSRIRLRKLDASSLDLAASLDVSSGPGVYDEVNGLAFTMDASGRKYVYAAGASGSYPLTGTLRKFADTGAAISTAVPGNWPVQYSNPGGGNSRALAVKADINGNLVVTGSEQRYDLNQGENIWLNRYTPYGAAMFSSPARYNNAQSNSDDIPAGLDLDSFGNIYVSGYTDMWNLRQGYNMLLVKFGPGGQFLFGRVYDSGSDSHDAGLDVFVSSDNYAHVSGMFAGAFGVYSMPQGSSASAQFFTAAEGPYTGSADLMWNYPAALPAGSTYYVQYSTASAPVWSSASAQIVVSTGPLYPGAVQTQTVGGLPVLRYPGLEGAETRGNLYKFKVWITSGGLTTALPEAQTFAKTPSAYDNTQDFGRERLSFMSGLSGPDGGIAVDGAYVYHAFGGYADGASAGFGLRKYNTGQYLEWTKFFNHKDDRAYYVARVVRDAAGNFYMVGSQRPASNTAAAAGYEHLAADKDLWIAKLNAAGDLVWSYSADASGGNGMDELYGAAVEGSALYVVGVASSASAGMDILARKYDISPSTYPALLWTYSKNGSGNGDDFGYGIAVGTGAVYLVGTAFDGAANKDIIVQGLNKTSASQTATAAGAPIVFNSSGNGDDTGYDLAVTTTGFVYVAGSTASVSAPGNAALLKFTLGGALVWDRYYNGKDNLDDAAYAVELTTSGVIAAGYETSSGQGRVSIYRKFTLAGDLEWSRGLNLSAGDDYASALAVDASGRVYSAVSLDGRPGFYYFPEPDFNVLAAPYGVPGSVRLEWLSQYDVPAGSVFSVQYSTYDGGWGSSGAQVRYAAGADIREGMREARVVYGLESVTQYFKVWVSTSAGTFTPVGVRAASARPLEGSVFAAMSMYPNEAKLFVTGGGQRYNDGEKEFPGAARDASGNLYMVADTDWNGSGGLVIKKFNSALTPVWTKYYAPGESFAVRANRMAADAEGYLYLTGYERGPAAADGKDLFVMKFGASGLVWKTVYDFAHGDDTGYGVALDASGNVYAAGSVYTGSAQGDNIFLAKLSTAGVILSSANFDGSGSGPDAAYGIAVRGTDLYLAGSAYQSVNGQQLWTGHFRTSDLGQLGTAITGGAAAGAGYDVAVDSSGYVYTAGELRSADTANDAIVIKSSADLSAADWAFPVLYNSPGNANDAAYGIALDTTGSVYVTGSQERYDINQGKNLWIRKYSRSGSELWSQEFHTSAIAGDAYSTIANSDEGFDLAVGTMGFVSVSGKFNGYYGLYRYKQSSALTVTPVLTVKVSSAAVATPLPGVGVSLVPYSQTGGIDSSGIRRGVTDSAGVFAAQVPAGKQYFIALDKQGFAPGIVAQQMDPYGTYFVQLNAAATKQYILSPRPAASPYYPLTVTVTSATAGDYVMAEVFFAQTGERAAYGIAQVAVGASSVTFSVSNVPPAVAGAYTLGVTIPNRSLARSVPMGAAFPAVSLYVVNMSTITGSSTGGFEVGASTTLPSLEGVVRNARTLAPLEAARVRVWNSTEPCASGNCDYNVYETLTDVNGKYSFYNVVSTAAAYSLSAQKAGYNRGLYEGISVSTGATVYREFQLQEATYTLRGVIRYRDVPVPNADVLVVGDYGWYIGSDTYKNGKGMYTDAKARTAADGSFLFSPATLNGLPDGQLRMSVAFFGKWLDLNEGNYQDLAAIDADDARIVISSAGAAGVANSGCTAGRNWKLAAAGGACQGYGDINFNIMPQKQNDYATLSGSVTFVTTYTVSAVNPLVISTVAPVTVMALQECSGVCADRSMGFAVLSGTYTVNVATYSIKLSTGMTYYTRVTASEWAEVSAFDDRADFKSTSTLSLTMNFVVTKAGSLKGVVKMPDGSSYKPAANLPEEQAHSLDILLRGQNVDVNEAWSVDDYGAFEFPNLAPGLYTVTMKPNGLGFRWAAPAVSNVAVVPGKVTQVTLKLADGLVVQPQVSGSTLPVISTPAWTYRMIPVESGVAMTQKKLTELLFGEDAFAFSYSTATQTWEKKVMLTGKYDFYLTMGARYAPEAQDGSPANFDHFAAFIGKVRGFSVQRSTSSPDLGTDAQPLPVSVSGAPGAESLEGTMLGERIYSDADLDRVFSNFDEIFSVAPTAMLYDAAGDLRGYSAGLPSGAQFAGFEAALQTKDKALVRAYFAAHPGRFMVSGLPAGRYTAVFSDPNYPPVTKEITLPLGPSYNGSYAFTFDEQTVRTGDIYGTVKSSATGAGLDNAVVYLKHRTVEKFTNTASDGSFRFSGLPSGIYRLGVTREGFVKAGQRTTLAGALTGDDSSQVDFYLTPSQSNLAGKVYLSKFPAPLTTAGVAIVAYDETYNTLHPAEYLPKIEATTNDDGDYELAGVVPGHNYKVTAFYSGKLPATLDVSSDAVTEGVTYLPDIVMCEVAPQIKVKVIKSPAAAGLVDVTIISPKQLVSMPVCTVNDGAVYDAATATALALAPGPNNTYSGHFTESLTQLYYSVYVSAGDGANTMEKTVVYSSVDQGRAEQYIQEEAIQGGDVQMDPEGGDYSGIELDAGALTSSGTASGTSGYRSSVYRASASDGLVGGFFSALPSVRTIRTAKGDLNIAQAIQDLMASEVYNMELENASVNKPFTLTLTYDKNKAAENGNLRIYQYDDATGAWKEVPGDYTLDPTLGVLSVGVAALTNAHDGTGGIDTPLGRKRLGMSAVVNGRYVPSATSTQQSGRFAVFTAMPPTGVAYAGAGFRAYNMPNPFDLKSKNVALSSDIGASGIANPYATNGTLIKYHLPAGNSGTVKFVIYNLAGEKVRTITDGVRAGGQIYYSEWDGRNDNGAKCASGVYFMLTYLDGKQLGGKAHKMAIIK